MYKKSMASIEKYCLFNKSQFTVKNAIQIVFSRGFAKCTTKIEGKK